MPLVKLPSGEIVSTIVRFGKDPYFCNVTYNDVTFNLDYDPGTDLYLRHSGDTIPDTVVAQVNDYIKSDKVDMTEFAHFLVLLEDEDYKYYASCNFHFYRDSDGICPSGAVQVYILDPRRGSITTMLEHDAENNMYVVVEDFEQLDSLQIDTISQAIKEHQARVR
jgi:hypothetical protein